ncbi:hypothetical protein DNTS_021771 [Danionella cerebrum]|uniref:Uncharacterized protein n=1 Tax=Danionella cerebrum TaxID=2873325 RepID=A0A553QNS9_9TELE|nr:hypothetical protein DNTS_021771 [Danionella translucida]
MYGWNRNREELPQGSGNPHHTELRSGWSYLDPTLTGLLQKLWSHDGIMVHGAHLKASAAMVRLRLYDILALLPPKSYEGKSS